MIVDGRALVFSNHSVQLKLDGGVKKGEEDTASGFASSPSFMGALSDMRRTQLGKRTGFARDRRSDKAVIRQYSLIDPVSLNM
jgi:hypothetical protein